MRLVSPLFAVWVLFLPLAARADDPACGHRTDVIKELSERYKEAPVAVGLASNGSLLEVLSSNAGTTWTIIVTSPDGTSCLVAAGEDWQPTKAINKASGQAL
ncbi:MAG TPA: hypothetical protein VHA10_00930 [Hypericibacter adhaerens]|jgi:hypothetical protein|uniref:Uncharacterized protein n=1 Tax=Hypericibacter adhaerens TaxID=2602016 RepID=A0A5J6MZT3_9PROT|nr:hypothetical protein [Hypericibacter adhaerens]QEX22484.1 hypothetical protein FRZ61_24160 [Hypericibacter adhaerens]HWA41744.1 hypothetical protein [Hypericibacter adhaerens]